MHWSDEQFLELSKKGFKYGIRAYVPNFVTDTGIDERCVGVHKYKEIYELLVLRLWKKRSIREHWKERGVKIEIDREPYSATQHLITAVSMNGSSLVLGYFCDLSLI